MVGGIAADVHHNCSYVFSSIAADVMLEDTVGEAMGNASSFGMSR